MNPGGYIPENEPQHETHDYDRYQPVNPLYYQQPKQVKKSKKWLWIIPAVLFVAALLCGVGVIVTSLNSDNASNNSTSNNDRIALSPTASPSPSKKPRRWHNVIAVSGSADKKTGFFHLGNGEKRLIYQVTGGQYAVFAIYVLAKGVDLNKQGGLPEVLTQGNSKDTTALIEDDGDYYISVTSANAKWKVTLQELK